MSQTVGFLVDMLGMSLDDGPTWIQALPLGTYQHPQYGEIKISPERVQAFATNLSTKVIDKQPDIDYDHKKRVDHAAGWVEAAEARPDGLWIQVNWTPKARQMLKDGEYRYFSPEFIDEWKHPKTQAVHKDVLLGGALTNRPFLKDILPINLSEVFENAYKEGGSVIDTKVDPNKKLSAEEGMAELAKKHGLDPAKATVEEIIAAAAKADPSVVEPPKVTEVVPPVVEPAKEPATLSQTLSDDDKKNPLLVKMAEIADAQAKSLADAQKQIDVLVTANRFQDADNRLLQLSDDSNGAKVILAPAIREEAREIMVGVPKELSDKFVDLLGKVTAGKATVQLGEVGSTRAASSGSATKAFNDAVQQVRTDKKLTYTEAVGLVAAEQPKLFEDYQTATMLGEND
jgi:hypothetical protein